MRPSERPLRDTGSTVLGAVELVQMLVRAAGEAHMAVPAELAVESGIVVSRLLAHLAHQLRHSLFRWQACRAGCHI